MALLPNQKADIQQQAKDRPDYGDQPLAKAIRSGDVYVTGVSYRDDVTFYSVLNVVRRARKSNRYSPKTAGAAA